MSSAGIVLAAGASTRAGFPKALARIGDASFIELAVSALAPAGDIVVVVAAPHADAIRRSHRGQAARFVENPDPGRGMLSSLQVGIAALSGDAEAAVVSLIDHPRVAPATVRTLLDAWTHTRASVVRPVFRGRRGHPIVIDRSGFLAILIAPAESSTREALARLGSRLDVEVNDPAILEDLDTPQAVSA